MQKFIVKQMFARARHFVKRKTNFRAKNKTNGALNFNISVNPALFLIKIDS